MDCLFPDLLVNANQLLMIAEKSERVDVKWNLYEMISEPSWNAIIKMFEEKIAA